MLFLFSFLFPIGSTLGLSEAEATHSGLAACHFRVEFSTWGVLCKLIYSVARQPSVDVAGAFLEDQVIFSETNVGQFDTLSH